jgi:predicted nuclease with TOPRIM domain
LNEAYKSVQFESLKQMYLLREKLLSIITPKVDVEELREKLRGEMEQQKKQLQIMVNSLVTENMDLKRRISMVEEKFSHMEKTIQDLKKTVGSAPLKHSF